MPKPFPIYTDGVNLYTSFDGGVTLLPLGGETATNNVAAPISGDGTIATPFTIAAGAVALTKLATQANNTVVGNIAGTASPVALTATQLTALVNPATASLPGAMTAAQFAALPSGPVIWAMLRTPIIDMTAAPAKYTFGAELTAGGAFPGYYAVGTITRIVILSVGGALSTQPVLSIGNDASNVNMVHSFTFNLATQFSTGAPSAQAIGTNPLATDLLVDMTTAAQVNITTAAAGSSLVLTARFYMFTALIPVA